MNTAAPLGRFKEMSPRAKARLAGLFYLITMVAGIFTQNFVSGGLVVPGDAAATARNIVAGESLYRLGFAVYIVELLCQVTMTWLLYDLLKPVSRSASLLAAVVGFIGITIKTVARLFFATPLLVLGGANYLQAFSAEQLQSLALLLLRINTQAEMIAMVFFGLYALVKGHLVFRSTFLPKVLGVLSAVGGLAWMTYLYEPLATAILPYILAVVLLGALPNVMWLLVVGVNEKRWKEQLDASRESIWR